MESKPATSSGSSSVKIAATTPSSATAPAPARAPAPRRALSGVQVIQRLVSGAAPTPPPSGQGPVPTALPVSQQGLVHALPVAPPVSQRSVPSGLVAPPSSQGLPSLDALPVTVAPPTSHGLPDSVLPLVALPGGGNPVSCIHCCRMFAFDSSDIPGLVPPPGFTYQDCIGPLPPPPARTGASSLPLAAPPAPLPVCTDPNHFILTMHYMPIDVLSELDQLVWLRPTPNIQPTAVRPAAGGGQLVEVPAPGVSSAIRPLNPMPAPAVPNAKPVPPATTSSSAAPRAVYLDLNI